MSDDSFKVGDVVLLKSGGPSMTVSHVAPDGSLLCVWFPDQSSVKTASELFVAAVLQSANFE